MPSALPRCLAACLSGLRAARRVHDHESRSPHRSHAYAFALVGGNSAATAAHRFYDEYNAVIDLPARSAWKRCSACFQPGILGRLMSTARPPQRDPAHRAADRGRRARRYLRDRPDRRRATTCAPASTQGMKRRTCKPAWSIRRVQRPHWASAVYPQVRNMISGRCPDGPPFQEDKAGGAAPGGVSRGAAPWPCFLSGSPTTASIRPSGRPAERVTWKCATPAPPPRPCSPAAR